jgi:hypothetical protein
MKDKFKTQDEETMWYENYGPVREYLASEFSRKSRGTEKDSRAEKFSWLEMMKKSFHIK